MSNGLDADIENALFILERAKPQAARLLRQKLEIRVENPNVGMIDDLREAANIMHMQVDELLPSSMDNWICKLADRLSHYALVLSESL